VLFEDLRKTYPLPLPKIVHSIWCQKGSKVVRHSGCRLSGWWFGKRTWTEEPDEGNLQVRVCGGSAG
jgi:hypothetical protein